MSKLLFKGVMIANPLFLDCFKLKINSRSLIQPLETLSIELTGTKK